MGRLKNKHAGLDERQGSCNQETQRVTLAASKGAVCSQGRMDSFHDHEAFPSLK